jgi:hypothetical protein
MLLTYGETIRPILVYGGMLESSFAEKNTAEPLRRLLNKVLNDVSRMRL